VLGAYPGTETNSSAGCIEREVNKLSEHVEREFLPSRPFTQMPREDRIRYLKTEIDRLDREMATTHSKKMALNYEFQTLLSANATTNTSFELKPLIDEQREIPPLRRPMGAPDV
jgi:hypothetical protein